MGSWLLVIWTEFNVDNYPLTPSVGELFSKVFCDKFEHALVESLKFKLAINLAQRMFPHSGG